MPAEPAVPTGPTGPTGPDAPVSVAQVSVVRAVAVYTGLRVALMAVLSVLAWLVGLPWIPAIAAGVILATVVSLLFLRPSTRRLSAVLAAASARNRAARPGLRPVADGDPTGDLYDVDPYADDEEEAGNPDDLADQQRAAQAASTQAASTSASPTSRP